MDPLPGYPGRKQRNVAPEPQQWAWKVGMLLIALGWLIGLGGLLLRVWWQGG